MSTRRPDRSDSSSSGFHLLEKLRQRRDHHRTRSRVVRTGFMVAGVCLIIAGLFMLVLPGPGMLTLALGLYLLALEFDWAERLLRRALEHAHRATNVSVIKRSIRWVQKRPRTAAALLAITLALTTVVLLSILRPEIVEFYRQGILDLLP